MVCDQCSRKLTGLITTDNSSKRVYGNLKVESNTKYTNGKYAMNKCISCNGRAEGKNKYCLTCAYKKGICEMCGKQLMNTKMYKFNDINSKDDKRKKKIMERSRNLAEEIIKEKNLAKIDEKKDKQIDSQSEIENIKPVPQPEIKRKEFIPLLDIDNKDDDDDTKNKNKNKEDKDIKDKNDKEDDKENDDDEYDEVIQF